jgi:hypothetical protein
MLQLKSGSLELLILIGSGQTLSLRACQVQGLNGAPFARLRAAARFAAMVRSNLPANMAAAPHNLNNSSRELRGAQCPGPDPRASTQSPTVPARARQLDELCSPPGGRSVRGVAAASWVE